MRIFQFRVERLHHCFFNCGNILKDFIKKVGDQSFPREHNQIFLRAFDFSFDFFESLLLLHEQTLFGVNNALKFVVFGMHRLPAFRPVAKRNCSFKNLLFDKVWRSEEFLYRVFCDQLHQILGRSPCRQSVTHAGQQCFVLFVDGCDFSQRHDHNWLVSVIRIAYS